MILTNTENLTTPSKADNGVLPKESDNKGMWKQALEKNGLYEALHKFETIKFYKNNEAQLSIDKREYSNKDNHSSSTDPAKFNSLKETINQETNSNNNFDFVSNRSQKDLSLVSRAFLNQSFNRPSALPKSSQTTGMTRDFLRDIKWTNKNVIATNVNSNLEIWIRDGGISGSKLKDMLKNIKHSMAELGASLSKVSLNGKVVFENKK